MSKTLQQVREDKLAELRVRCENAIKEAGGNIAAASRALGISRYTLHRHLRKFKLLDEGVARGFVFSPEGSELLANLVKRTGASEVEVIEQALHALEDDLDFEAGAKLAKETLDESAEPAESSESDLDGYDVDEAARAELREAARELAAKAREELEGAQDESGSSL